MTITQVVLEECGTDSKKLALMNCHELESLKQKIVERIGQLVDCVGTPVRIGNETYDHTAAIKSLTELLDVIQGFCDRAKRKRTHRTAIPGGTGDACRLYGNKDGSDSIYAP